VKKRITTQIRASATPSPGGKKKGTGYLVAPLRLRCIRLRENEKKEKYELTKLPLFFVYHTKKKGEELGLDPLNCL